MHQTGARARLPELPSSYPVAQPRRDRRLARPRLQRTAVVHGDDDAVGSCQDAMWRLQTSVTNGCGRRRSVVADQAVCGLLDVLPLGVHLIGADGALVDRARHLPTL